MLFASVVLSSCAAAAQESVRVIDEDPYDVLTLKEDGQQFKVVPLEMAKRRPPTAGSADSKLLVRLQKRPEQQYQIAWGDIEKVQLFEEIVLSEAGKLVDARAFDEAFEYYEFIKKRAPDFPGLVDAQRTCMFREAEHWGQQGQYGHVLALLNELYEQDARYPDLKRAIGVAVDRLVEQYFSKEENAAARVLLAELDDRFPDHEVVKKRRQELIDRSNRALQEARAESEKGAMREAHDLAEESFAIWPELPGASDLLKQLQGDYPIVEVGVRNLSGGDGSGFTIDWDRRRQQRLSQRWLFELAKFTDAGGEYDSPLGECELKDSVLSFKIDPGARWSAGGQPLTSNEVAQGILAAWNSQDVEVPIVWRSMLTRVDPADAATLNLHWRAVPPKWQPLLRLSPINLSHASSGLAPYRLAERTAGIARFVAASPGRDAPKTSLPREVIERRFGAAANAIDSLRRKEIQVLDRLPPWELPNVRRFGELEIGRYAAPTVHMLVINPDSEVFRQRLFRRGLVHALNRAQILAQLVGSDAAATGMVLSGPFPRGHAYDEEVQPRSWNPRLAIALWQQDGKPSEAASEPIQLTLVYPPSEIARRAVRAMQQQLLLNEMGISLQLREGSAADQLPAESWDVQYIEWPAMEPVIDAARLLGPGGVAQIVNSGIKPTLERLAQSATMADAQSVLHELHRLAHSECLVIPLWQLDEFFLYHKSLTGVGTRPTTLYQSIEDWKMELD